jgi:hypothetical protein
MNYKERLEKKRESDAEKFVRKAHAKGTFAKAFNKTDEPFDGDVDKAFYKAGAAPRDILISKLAEALRFITEEAINADEACAWADRALTDLTRFLEGEPKVEGEAE